MAKVWTPLGGNGGIPSTMVSTPNSDFWRLKVQSLTVGMQYIVDGIGFTANWIERSIGNDESRYLAFDVPAGYKLALDYRSLNTSSELAWYFVYPQGTYTLDAPQANIFSTGFVKTQKLRQDGLLTGAAVSRYTITGTPPDKVTDSTVAQPIWGNVGAGNRVEGSLAPDSTFLLLNDDQQFLLEMYNEGGNGLEFQVVLNYALIPVDQIPEI